MSYTEVILTSIIVIGVVASLFLLHFPIFALVGIFAKKTWAPTEKKLRYGIVVSARNEELVIGDLLRSIRACRYPADRITVFVMAHNCSDRTAQISRELGAVVYEYNNPAENRVGYAYRKLFQLIEADYGTQSFDGFLIMDADNTLTPDYLSKMNDAFVGGGGKSIVTSFRNAKNFSQNYLSTLYGIFFISSCRLESRGRTVCGCSTRVSGTGYVIPAKLVEQGWHYVTLTEDWELTADVVRLGGKILYCDEAEFFDEQPTQLPIMLRQRLRWARGHMEVFFSSFRKVASSFLHPKKTSGGGADRLSKYDIGVQIMPLGVIGVTILLVQLFLMLLSPLFGDEVLEALRLWMVFYGVGLACTYWALFLTGVLVLLLEHRRIGRLRLLPTLLALVLYPFFQLLNIPLDVASLFTKNLVWKPIPHSYQQTDDTSAAAAGAPARE